MKRIIIAFAAIAAAFSLASCNKEQMNDQPAAGVKFNITVSNLGGSPDTKAVKTAWEDGDKINLWLGYDYLGSGPHAVLTYNSAQDKWVGETTSSFESTVRSEGAVRALYEGYNDFSKFNASSTNPYATAPGYSSSTGAEMPMAVTSLSSTTYTYDGTTLTARIEWQFLTNVQVVVAGLDPDKASSYRLKSPNLTSMGGLYSASSSNPSISSGLESTGGYTKGVANKDGVAFYFTSRYKSAECDRENTWEFTLSDNTGSEAVEYTYSTTGNIGSSVYKLNAIKIDASKFQAESDYESVDLGLSVKWATMNVGATKPEDYGYYFAWGETSEKSNYSWSNEGDYKWGIYDSSASPKYGMTKYTADVEGGDGLKTLQPGDDPATANWGTKWRTPTIDEINELLDNTKCEWTWDATKKGYTVKGLKTGNSIFLPAAGYRYGSDLYKAGSSGRYWSSSVRELSPNDAYFWMAGQGWGRETRVCGLSVRAVTE